MNQPQLPAHLQNRQHRNLAETATQGLGGALPPHISIRGNQFRLVDGAGNEQPVVFTNPADNRQYAQPYLDVCIFDLSDVICKQFYPPDKPWTPDSNDPPLCWSANGIGPSREAPQPQSRTCGECPNNVRGSAVSKISGAAIKACRDEKWAALTLPGFGKDMVFQLKLTPGSFQNWKGYVEKFKGQSVDISDVVTRLEFEQGVNGVLKFEVSPVGYIDAATADLCDRVLAAKGSDIFVGRNDQPITMLAAPASAGALAAPDPYRAMATVVPAERITGFAPALAAPYSAVAAPLAPPAYQPAPAATAVPPQTFVPAAPPPTAPAAPPASFPPQGADGPAPQPMGEPAPARRRRRTAAEMAAAAGAPAGSQQAPTTPNFVQPTAPAQPQQAPFRQAAPAAPFAQPQGRAQQGAPPFGVGQGVPPNPELAAMLDKTFGPALR